ncbi:acyl carrier protein [Azorhizophilus paspali]|uniref:Acyl carrier protein n=1 Tax=Azorhizophilus paspali TaxID=69963 RepID=A0ABV6SGH6_AZOPA
MSVEQRLKEILVSEIYVEVPVEKIEPTDSLRDALGVDSMGFVELKDQIEGEYKIKISDDDFTPENFGTINALCNLINKLKG